MIETRFFEQFSEQCVPTLEARMNFNRQLAESSSQSSDNELLDYWQSIAPAFTKFIGTPTDSVPRLELLKTMGKLASDEADYYQSLITFLTAKEISAPDTDDLKLNAIKELTNIHVKILCKWHLVRDEELTFKAKKNNEILQMLKESRKSKSASSVSISKSDRRQFQSDADKVFVESWYLEEISGLFSEFLSNYSPSLAGFLSSISPQNFVGKAGEPIVLYTYNPLKIMNKIDREMLALLKMFNINKAKLSTEQQREYFTLVVDLSKDIGKSKEESLRLSECMYNCNITDTEKLVIDYSQLSDLLSTIEKIHEKINFWIEQYNQMQAQTVHQKTLESAVDNEENDSSRAALEQQFSGLSIKEPGDENDINSINVSDRTADSQKMLVSENNLPIRLQAPPVEANLEEIECSEETYDDYSSYASSSASTLWQYKRSSSANSGLLSRDADQAVLEHQNFQIIADKLKNHKETFQKIFEADIHLKFREKDLIAIIKALGGEVKEGAGSRKRICLNHVFSDTLSPSEASTSKMVVHSQHGRKASSRDGKLPSFCVKNYVQVITKAGLTPEKLWPEEYASQTASPRRKSEV